MTQREKQKQKWIKDVSKPIKLDSFDGNVAVHSITGQLNIETKLFDNLISYKKGGVLNKIPIKLGRRYDFDSIAQEVVDTLNRDEQVVLFYYNNSRVKLRVYEGTNITDIKIPSELETKLGLSSPTIGTTKQYKEYIGDIINKADIHFQFFDPSYVHITCDELYNKSEDGDDIAVLRVDQLESLQFNYPQPCRAFKNNYIKELHLHIKDQFGNELPLNNLLLRVVINEQ